MLFNNCWSFERRMANISLIRSVLRCTTASTMTDQSLYLSTTRHPQDVKYKRSTSGALPLASTFKCEFVTLTMSLSSYELLAGTARQEAASGEPSNGRHKISLCVVLDQVCLVSATNGCFQIQVRPQGTGGRAGRRQEQSSCTQHNMNIIEV